MAKVTVTRNTYGVKFPNQRGKLLRIMKSEFEPPKTYLWEDEDGYLYVYNCGRWQYIKYYIKNPKCDCENPTAEVTQEDFDQLKSEIYAYLENVLDIAEYPEDLETRLENLENKEDHDTIYNDTELRNQIQDLLNRINDNANRDAQAQQDIQALSNQLTYMASDNEDLRSQLQALQAALIELANRPDQDTIYDDTAILNQLSELNDRIDQGQPYNDEELRNELQNLANSLTTNANNDELLKTKVQELVDLLNDNTANDNELHESITQIIEIVNNLQNEHDDFLTADYVE